METIKTQSAERSDRLLRGLIWFAALVVTLWGLIQAKEFLIPIFLAALLAMLMVPGVRLLRRFNVPEWAALTISSLLLFLPLFGLASLLAIEGESLIKNWPEIYGSAHRYFDSFASGPWLGRLHLGEYADFSTIEAKVSESAGEGALLVFTGLKTLLSAGTTTLLILTFSVIMLAARTHLRSSFESILSTEDSPQHAHMLDGSLGVLEKFLLARVLIILFVAVADFIILKIFGVSYGVTLSVVLGLSTLVPAIGFFIGIIPPLIVAASEGNSALFLVGLFAALWAISSLQDHVMTPKLIGRKLNLNFLFTYLAIFAGERMWGLWGMFLSIPALGLIRVILSTSDELRPWARLLEEEDGEASKVNIEVNQEAQKPPAVGPKAGPKVSLTTGPKVGIEKPSHAT
jgi:predicted PurR-regulated permease PerM